jgi:hypothetical protein
LTRISELGTEPPYSVSIRGITEILLDVRDPVREKLYRTEPGQTCVIEAGCTLVNIADSVLLCLEAPFGRQIHILRCFVYKSRKAVDRRTASS